MDKERFSLLLLEPNEIYFEDFSVNLIDANAVGDQKSNANPVDSSFGRLKMCSKSIVYVPKDTQEPLVKIAYKDCDQIFEWVGNFNIKETNVLAVSCSQYTHMLDQNVLAPYRFVAVKRLFLFHLHYGRVDMYLNQLCQLHRASSLHAFEQNDMIATIVFSRYNRLKFDPLWLGDIFESVVADFTVEQINPLIMNPGRLLLSSNGIYFQPYNNIQPYPVMKISLKSLTSLAKRRYLLRHTSLEIKWTDNNGGNVPAIHTLYVSFRNVAERDEFYERAMEQDELCIKPTEQESMTLKWQNGIISNYDYLLYLNSLADRTFQDLTQYPIFPWIISDYTSPELNLNDPQCYRDLTKPIGALNPERLMRLKERCEEMGDPKFLYGSHYSAPGFVLFYLVRKYPKLMLCLQNGRFDHPDRMFNRVDDAYHNCLSNMSDFKELIPEFYDTTQGGDFLLNKHKINFGTRHDGTAVSHVVLPPWADGSAEKFIEKLREALESDYVSQNLNHWIDLIFGYKQRGDEAIKSDNLFYYLCYEGSVNLDHVNGLADRHALEVQISEFGQIPKQLFDKPHVPKAAALVSNTPDNDGSSCGGMHISHAVAVVGLTGFSVHDVIQSHKDAISCVIIDNNNVFSTGKDGLLKCYNIADKRQLSSVAIGSLPLSCCIKIPEVNALILGSWDNSIMTYNLDYWRVVNEIPAHDDAVSCMSLIDNMGVLVSGSWDCSVKVWKGYDSTAGSTTSFRLSDSMLAYLPLEEKVSSVQATRSDEHSIRIAIGTFGGDVWLWSLRLVGSSIEVEPSEPQLLVKHEAEVTAVSFNSSATKVVSSCLNGLLHVCDIATGMTLFQKQHTHPLTCLSWRYADDFLLLGDEVGMLTVWNMQTGSVQLQQEVLKGGGIISSIAAATDDKRYVIVACVERDTREFSIVVLKCSQS